MNWEGFIKSLRGGATGRTYLFTGDDRYLKAKSLEQLASALFPKGKGEVIRYQAPEEIPQAVRDAKTYPFFSSLRLIILENAEAVPDNRRALLEPILKEPSPFAILALVADDDTGNRSCPRWIRQHTTEVRCTATQTDIRRWILAWFKRQGLRPSPEALRLLVDRAGGKFGSIVADLEKTALLCSTGGTITVEQARMASLDHSEEQIFALTDAVLNRDRSRGIQALEDLLAQGQPPGQILTMLAKSLKLRWALTDTPSSRKDEEIAAALRLSARWVGAARRRGEEAAPDLARRLWNALDQADQRFKTSAHNESLILLASLAPCFPSGDRSSRELRTDRVNPRGRSRRR